MINDTSDFLVSIQLVSLASREVDFEEYYQLKIKNEFPFN